jgi:hypothetical protein
VVEGPAQVVVARGVRQVQDGDDARLPDDEPGVGRAVHEDRGLVTDAGGVASHPAVVAREFGSRRRRHVDAHAGDQDGRPRPRQRRDVGTVEILA